MTLFEIIHFNRPEWLWLIPIVALLTTLFYLNSTSTNLKKVVAPHLIPYLTTTNSKSVMNRWGGLACIIIFIIGLAGFSVSKTQTELYNSTHKTVFIVDQSLSLYATDVRPNRLTKAKQLLRDIINSDISGEIALVAFAGDAYVISPFTQDKETLIHFLVALDPVIMPLYGSRLTTGLDLAVSLLDTTDTQSNFVVLTDDLTQTDAKYLRNNQALKSISIDVITVGTEKGAEILLPNGETLRRNNLPVIPTTPVSQIKALVEEIGGNAFTHESSGSDIARIGQSNGFQDNVERTQVSGITWKEQGHWLALPFLIWLLWQFKTRVIFCLLLALPFLHQHADASPLDWFKTKDQQAQEAVNIGDWQRAANLFTKPDWKAASLYATQDYQGAAELLAPIASSPEELYNLANATALSGDLESAVKTYERALELKPNFKEAQENLDYLKQKMSDSEHQNGDDKLGQDSSNQSSPSQSTENSDQRGDQEQDKNSEKTDNQNESSEQSEPEVTTPSSIQEDQQALDQWLRQIQDDPGTLLQRKLWYLHQERRNENHYNQEEGIQPW